MPDRFVDAYDRLSGPGVAVVTILAAAAGLLIGGGLIWLAFTFQRAALAIWAFAAAAAVGGCLIERAQARS